MKKSFLLVVLVAICLFLFPRFSLANEEPMFLPPDQNLGTFQGESDFDPDLSEVNEIKDAMDSVEKKLSYQLLQLTDSQYLLPNTSRNELIEQMKEQRQIAEAPMLNNANGSSSGFNVYVYVKLKEGNTPNILSKYVSKIEDQDMDYNLVTAWVDVNSLKSLAAMDAVQSIKEVIPPIVYVGSFTSKGDTLLKADVTRAMGANGNGIKVGIISDGVDNYASAVASGDIPSNLTVLSNAIGGDEGTAMLEIVHDLAPAAKLYFHDCGTSTLAFNRAIDALKNAGCDIICDDIGWITEPFFEDGIVAQHIENLTSKNDIIYVSSAGNAADAHYQGLFHDCGDGTADFSNGSNALFPYLYVTLYPGENIRVVMEWNDPFGDSGNDYDLYLYDRYTSDLLVTNPNVQDGDDDPLEFIYYRNNTGGNVYLEIVAKKMVPTDENKTLEIYVYGGHLLGNNLVSADSIFGHPAVPGVLSCGAIYQGTPNDIEYFSSLGPVTMLTETRQKPDICGIDGVSVSGAGGFGSYSGGRYYFYGTSASAPHIAAVAAQLKSRFPSFSASQIKQLILDNAVDLGDAGYDNIFGYGRANAYAAALSHLIVTFDSRDGSAVSSQTVAKNGKATKPSDPVRSGYKFEGWYKEKECTTPWNFSQDTVTQDTTLYAKFTKLKTIRYQTHVQDIGWQGWKTSGEVAGTSGQSLRLEGMYIDVEGADNAIEYRTHVQNIGWQDWANEGEMTGTSGRSLRLEAIEIRLKGDMASIYDIYYRVHAQNIGWMDWAKNGQSAGTAGLSYRLEAIQIQLIPKGGAAPGSTAVPFKDANGSAGASVKYRTHVQNVGWQGWKSNGEMAGTSGQSLRLEGMYIDIEGADHAIEYRTHVQDIGWQGWVNEGEMTGTSGRSLRLEAIEIRLKGDMAANYDIYYRVHAQNIGWMDWAKNGKSAGTAGLSYRLEAIQIVIVQKGGTEPGATTRPFVSA